MHIVMTGETTTSREELFRRSLAAGLDVLSIVNATTILLVTNDVSSGTAKARDALALDVPVVDEATYLRLLEAVAPGVDREQVVATPGYSRRPGPSWSAYVPRCPQPLARWPVVRRSCPANSVTFQRLTRSLFCGRRHSPICGWAVYEDLPSPVAQNLQPVGEEVGKRFRAAGIHGGCASSSTLGGPWGRPSFGSTHRAPRVWSHRIRRPNATASCHSPASAVSGIRQNRIAADC
jgi:hypothetical protein